ncbi:MAG: hypothetical protein ACYS9X_30250, partial [Planctomycetota bacterium]
MRDIPQAPALPGPLATLVRRADRRRRVRIILAAVARALWPGLVAATVLAAAWRLAGGTALGAALGATAWACVLLPIVFGFGAGLRRRDPLAAASELDRRSGLEAALATGLEVAAGRIAGPLAGAALAEAELAAARTGHETVPVAPPRARYLVVPAAVLAGVLLVPAGAARRPGAHVLVPADGAAGGRGRGAVELSPEEIAAARARAAERGAEDRAGPRDVRKDEGREDVAALPSPPPRARGRRARQGRSRAAAARGPESTGAAGAAAP